MNSKGNFGPGTWAGLGLALGAAAFGGFLHHRHRNRGGDGAAEFARRHPGGDAALVGRSVTIGKPRAELFAFWRDFSNLASFMENLEKVSEDKASGVSTWTIKAPAGRTVELRTRVSEETEGRRIAWRSVEGSDVKTSGEVRFADAPGERGTIVTLDLAYDPPAGAAGRAIAKAFGREPQVQARHDLKRFKMLMETGEITTSARTKDATRAAKQENA